MNDEKSQLELIGRYLDGIATPGEFQVLEELIVSSPTVRQEFLRYAHLDAALVGNQNRQMPTALFGVEPSPQTHAVKSSVSKRCSRLLKRPVAAAALGLIVGLCSASMLWAYVAPVSSHVSTLVTEGFESPSLKLGHRVILESGGWRGDRSVIVGEEQGVKPAAGRKMVRFLHEGYQGKDRPSGSHIADVYHLIDVRAFRTDIVDHRSVVQVSASMNATPFPEDEKYGCSISVYALDADSVPDSPLKIGTTVTVNSTAMARSVSTKLDTDPSRWQRLTAELQLPPNTEFLVIRLHIRKHRRRDNLPGTRRVRR